MQEFNAKVPTILSIRNYSRLGVRIIFNTITETIETQRLLYRRKLSQENPLAIAGGSSCNRWLIAIMFRTLMSSRMV